MGSTTVPGDSAMEMSVLMRLGGWQPPPSPPYCRGHISAVVVTPATHSLGWPFLGGWEGRVLGVKGVCVCV